MRILVLGASGFIGYPAAQALVRAGHHVLGMTRSQDKAKQFAREEIIPIITEVENPEEWIHIIKDLDAVVDCVGRAATRNSGEEIITSVSKAAQKLRPQGAPKLTYVYTSGSWVHGDNRTDIVTDTTPIKSPPQFLTWRLDREQLVLTDKNVNGLVIRPALLYGRSGSLLAPFFKSASEGHVWYPGTPAGRFTLVHADDLADLYVKATEKGAISRGLIFEGANDITESVDDVLSALVKVSGAKAPYEYKEPVDLYQTASGTTVLLRPYLARSLLGWTPRKPGLVDGLPIYYAAWKAAQ